MRSEFSVSSHLLLDRLTRGTHPHVQPNKDDGLLVKASTACLALGQGGPASSPFFASSASNRLRPLARWGVDSAAPRPTDSPARTNRAQVLVRRTHCVHAASDQAIVRL